MIQNIQKINRKKIRLIFCVFLCIILVVKLERESSVCVKQEQQSSKK